ncbi:MAG: translation initiation factor [Solirubrobacteraceae bacterium]|nr:translation initiation factor [Solirubrobacteraceae bacterium]
MPVPRRFDRRPPERDLTRINERIRVPEVRVIGEDGNQIGVMRTDEALRQAQQLDLDLVEVAPEARPPVVRILDYSKYKYEQAQKQKAARKHQTQITIREIKFRPKIAVQDYETKKRHVERFLRHKDKVKITIMFRGREVTHPERGQMILDRLAGELTELAIVEQRPNLDGRNMTMLLGPSKAVLAGTLGAEDGEDAADVEAVAENGVPAEAVAEDGAAPEVEAVEDDAVAEEPAAEEPVAEEPSAEEPAAAPDAEPEPEPQDEADVEAPAAEAADEPDSRSA